MWSRLLLPLFTTLWLSLAHIGPLWLSIALKLQSLLGSQRRCHAEAHSSGQCIRALVLIFAALVLGCQYLYLQLWYSGVCTYLCSLCTRVLILIFAACVLGRLYFYLQLVNSGVCTHICSLCITACVLMFAACVFVSAAVAASLRVGVTCTSSWHLLATTPLHLGKCSMLAHDLFLLTKHISFLSQQPLVLWKKSLQCTLFTAHHWKVANPFLIPGWL